MAKVTVDGIEVDVPNGSNVLQACEAAGVEEGCVVSCVADAFVDEGVA